MKANEFIKKFGLDKAKTLLSMQGKSIELLKSKYTARQLKEFQSYLVSGDLMRIDCLERMVESHKLIKNDFDSVEIAEYEYMISASYNEPYWIRVKQAIADVESCQ